MRFVWSVPIALRKTTKCEQTGAGKRIIGGLSETVFEEGFYGTFSPPLSFPPPLFLSESRKIGGRVRELATTPSAQKQKSEGNPFCQQPGPNWMLCAKALQPPPTCYRSLSGLSGPKCPRGVPRVVSGALRSPGSGVSKKCPESVPGVSKRCPGHSGDTLGTLLDNSEPEGP